MYKGDTTRPIRRSAMGVPGASGRKPRLPVERYACVEWEPPGTSGIELVAGIEIQDNDGSSIEFLQDILLLKVQAAYSVVSRQRSNEKGFYDIDYLISNALESLIKEQWPNRFWWFEVRHDRPNRYVQVFQPPSP